MNEFIVPKVCQYVVHGFYGDKNIANVLCYEINTTGSTMSRDDAIVAMGGILLNEWHTSVLPLLVPQYAAQKVSWMDLDSATGVIGERSASGGHTWPSNGGSAMAAMAGNVAVLVTKNLSASRGARRGRMYIGGVSEGINDAFIPNTMQASVQSTWQTAFTSFLGNTNQTDAILGANYQSWMVVPHILTRHTPIGDAKLGTPATGQGKRVSSLIVQARLATQRRRLR